MATATIILSTLATSMSGQWQEAQIPDMIPDSRWSSPPALVVLLDGTPVAKLHSTVILSNGRFAGWWWAVSETSPVPVEIASGNNRTVRVQSSGAVRITALD